MGGNTRDGSTPFSHVGQIERGERNLTYKSLLKLARGLGQEPAALMADEIPK